MDTRITGCLNGMKMRELLEVDGSSAGGSREIRTAEKDSTELWNQTRSGAWAGRGFHVQHLFSGADSCKAMVGNGTNRVSCA